ncbi:hypothetical protein FHS51_003831 [Sphingobium wenxiniae]|nr:hypothetical protein [Sphingobium wenxiniae]
MHPVQMPLFVADGQSVPHLAEPSMGVGISYDFNDEILSTVLLIGKTKEKVHAGIFQAPDHR